MVVQFDVTFSKSMSCPHHSVITHHYASEGYVLVGIAVDMLTTCRQQAQMLENSKKDTSVNDVVFFNAQVTCRRPVVVTNLDKYGHIGISNTGGSIYPKEYLVAILGVRRSITGINKSDRRSA